MNRDTVVFSTCSFLLGLVIGSLLIGPKLAHLSGGQPPSAGGGQPPSAVPAADTNPQNPMDSVRQQLASLNDAIARDPRNFDALVQLGTMYMDAAKFPQAIGYLERALAVREDPNVRTDLGICYKQNGQLDKALAAFRKAGAEAPQQWQPIYNEAIVLGEMRRFDEARALLPALQKMRPGDADVQRLEQALNPR
jgi:tetratricopeptide (TPR) repeat protein